MRAGAPPRPAQCRQPLLLLVEHADTVPDAQLQPSHQVVPAAVQHQYSCGTQRYIMTRTLPCPPLPDTLQDSKPPLVRVIGNLTNPLVQHPSILLNTSALISHEAHTSSPPPTHPHSPRHALVHQLPLLLLQLLADAERLLHPPPLAPRLAGLGLGEVPEDHLSRGEEAGMAGGRQRTSACAVS